MATELSNAERETHFNQTAEDHSAWIVFTDDPYWIRRLDRVGEFVRAVGAGKEYRLSAGQVSVKSKPKRLSEERRAQLAQQLQRARQTPVATDAKTPDGAL